ncbi:hypothetical protein V6N13_143466 [Hibiscus sabdariffa]
MGLSWAQPVVTSRSISTPNSLTSGLGPAEAPLEASSACPDIYGKRAYPGYARNLLVDATTDASYNAYGDNGRK